MCVCVCVCMRVCDSMVVTCLLNVIFDLIMFSCVAMVKQVKGAKIALLDFSLQKSKMAFGIHVVVDDPEKLDAIRARYSFTSCNTTN